MNEHSFRRIRKTRPLSNDGQTTRITSLQSQCLFKKAVKPFLMVLLFLCFSFSLFFSSSFSSLFLFQIPTRTGTMVHAFHLHVASPQAVILGGHVSHVDILTPSLTLVCIVDNVNNFSCTLLCLPPACSSPLLSRAMMLPATGCPAVALLATERLASSSEARALSFLARAVQTRQEDESALVDMVP